MEGGEALLGTSDARFGGLSGCRALLRYSGWHRRRLESLGQALAGGSACRSGIGLLE